MVGPKWVKEGPGRNYIQVAATRLSKEIDLKLCEKEYEELVQVLLGNSRQTMTPVAGEFLARYVSHGGGARVGPTQVRPQFRPNRFYGYRGRAPKALPRATSRRSAGASRS